MIIDAHLHLDSNVDGTAAGAAKELDQQLRDAGISRAIVLHLEKQQWPAKEFANAIAVYPRLHGFINVHPYTFNAIEQLHEGVQQLGFIGLKLHPRLQEFDVDDKRTVSIVQEAGKLNIPVLIDAFPDGTHLMQGFSPIRYAALAKQCPETKLIWAHMGGHYVIDFMMLAKRLPNVYMDLSFSLLYYDNSPVVDNMVYAMRSMKFERIFYGSDYPDRPVGITLNKSLAVLKSKGLSEDECDKIMFGNAINFFQWKDSV